jgi:hypothetical protein
MSVPGTEFICSVCGQPHEGADAWGYNQPQYWAQLTEAERREGRINDDLCATDDQFFFVRAVLTLPLIDGPQKEFDMAVWGTLSSYDFKRYIESFGGSQAALGPMSSYLATNIGQFPGSLNLEADLIPRDGGLRPLMKLRDADHPLVRAQRNGIRLHDAIDITLQVDRPIVPAEAAA